MKKCYVPKVFSVQHQRIIGLANQLLEGYSKAGIQVTLRSLYYRFVAKGWFPDDRKWVLKGKKWIKHPSGTKNAEPNYKWLGGIIEDARLAGLVDWTHLQDLTRRLQSWENFDSAEDALQQLSETYELDMWAHQKYRPEIWIEKDALVGVIRGVCSDNYLPYFSCRGYTSVTAMWKASMRLRQYATEGYTPVILHFGDHDPSGIDMSRDIADRLFKTFMADIEFDRLALNLDQIDADTPSDPAKVTDSRYKAYVERFGVEDCWELDGMDPPRFRILIQEFIDKLRDDKQWDADIKERDATKERLKDIASNWDKPHPKSAQEALEEIKKWKMKPIEQAALKRMLNARKRR